MTDRHADGRFGRTTKLVGKSGRRKNGQFSNGHARLGGRAPGTPNRTTRAVKEFLAELVDDPEVQAGVRERIMRGDSVAFFRALEQVIGRPVERFEGEIEHKVKVYKWKA